MNHNTDLVEIFDNEARISHRVIAKYTEVQQKNIVELITKYQDKMELFGAIPFKTEVLKAGKGTTKSKTFFLNEQQATLLLTFMRNNEIVINFKIKLVKEFFKMREILNSSTSQQTFDLDSYILENEKLIKLVKLITFENAITLHYLDKLTQSLNLKSPLELLKIDPNSYYFIPTELGKFFNKSAVEINKILEHKGYQIKVDGVWQLTDSGKKYAIQIDNNFRTIKWKLETVA
jgi:phage regulator Rha-like protein